MENEADVLVPNASALVTSHMDDFLPTKQIAAHRRSIQATEGVHQCRFPRSTRPDQRGILAPFHGQIDSVQGPHLNFIELVDLRDVRDLNKRTRRTVHSEWLNSLRPSFTGSNPDAIVHRQNEDLAVPDLPLFAGLCSLENCIDRRLDKLIVDSDL